MLGFYVGGSLTSHELTAAWWGWWLGDAASALLLAPALLVWRSPQPLRWRTDDMRKALRLIALLVFISISVHSDWIASASNQPHEYVFFPFVVWAALRLGQRGATLVTLVSSIIVTIDWKLAVGARPGDADIDDLLTIETSLCVLSVTGMVLALQVSGFPRRLPPLCEHQLLRIVQEAVTNMHKHAHAKRCRLLLNYSDNGLELIFEDDGTGFDPAAPTDGFGLLGICERIESINGKLALLTAPDKGTKIKVTLHTAIAETEV